MARSCSARQNVHTNGSAQSLPLVQPKPITRLPSSSANAPQPKRTLFTGHNIKRSSEMARSSFEFESLAADTPKQTLAFFFFWLHTAHTHTQSHTNVHKTQTHAPTRTQKCTHEHTHTRTHAQGRYKRGDICLIKSPTHPDKMIVKRLVTPTPSPLSLTYTLLHTFSRFFSLSFSLSIRVFLSRFDSRAIGLDVCARVLIACGCICVCMSVPVFVSVGV